MRVVKGEKNFYLDSTISNFALFRHQDKVTNKFVEIFGDKIDTKLPANAQKLEVGKTVEIGGIKFNILDAGDDAYSIEIPAINAVYRHMMGSNCHNILVSKAHIDAEILAMKKYQEQGYALILTSHYSPEGQAAVAQKLAYLEKVKMLAQESKTADEFSTAMKKAFPNYEGENYLQMTAGFLYK